MSKKITNPDRIKPFKTAGRSSGSLVIDPVIGDKVTVNTPKVLNARMKNNKDKYSN